MIELSQMHVDEHGLTLWVLERAGGYVTGVSLAYWTGHIMFDYQPEPVINAPEEV